MNTKNSRFPLVMQLTAAGAALLAVAFFLLSRFLHWDWLLSCCITFGTICYHFSMRLLVGALVPNTFSFQRRWFQPHSWEAALYRKLKLKSWKKHIPTYNPDLFCLEHNTLEQIVSNMCQAEVVHEVIALCSFLPLLAVPVLGALPVFLITSFLSACVDLVFVAAQRYNRPRIVRLLQKQRQ